VLTKALKKVNDHEDFPFISQGPFMVSCSVCTWSLFLYG